MAKKPAPKEGLDLSSFYNDSLDTIAKRQGFEASGLDVVPPMSSGLLAIDLITGGGFRPANYTGAGEEQCAKTTLALTVMGSAILHNLPLIAFIDFEGCWTEDTIVGYGKGKHAPFTELFDLSDKKSWKAGTWPGQRRTDIDTYESGHTNRGTGVRTGELFYRGRKPTFLVETNVGLSLRGYRHKMFVVRGSKLYMKYMEDLQVGEHVLVAKSALPQVQEVWRPVVGLGDYISTRYEVSNLGRVRSLPYTADRVMTSKYGKVVPQTRTFAGKLLSTTQLADGHLSVSLCTPSLEGTGPTVVSQQLVHRLVALAFLGKPPKNKSQVLHWNDDPTDNRVCNLHWGNDKLNAGERSLRGRAKSSHYVPEVSTEVISTVRAMRAEGLPREYISEKTGVSTWMVAQYCSEKYDGAYCDLDLEAALVHYELVAVTKAEPTGKKERVYDVSLKGVAADEIPHSIITNGIVTHNSTKNSHPYVHSILKGMGIKLSMDQVFGKKDEHGKWLIPPRVRYRQETILERFYDWLSEVLRELPDKRYVERKWWLVFDEKNKRHKAQVGDFYNKEMTRKYGNGLWVEAPDDKMQGIVFIDSYTAMTPECKDEETISNQLSVKASAFSKQLERVKGRLAQKMVAIYGLNHLRSNPMAMFGPKTDEKGGQALKQFSDVRFRQVSRSLSAAPFKVTKAKKSFDEVEPSVEFEGRLDTYRYVNVKAIKNKLWTPQRDVMMRIWVEDGSGTARGLCPVFDTIYYLKLTGQLKGNRTGFKLDLEGLGAAKKPIPWQYIKRWILGDKEVIIKICKALGYPKPFRLRDYCFKQMREGVAERLYLENRNDSAPSEGDDD